MNLIITITILTILITSSVLPVYSQTGSRDLREEYCLTNTQDRTCIEYLKEKYKSTPIENSKNLENARVTDSSKSEQNNNCSNPLSPGCIIFPSPDFEQPLLLMIGVGSVAIIITIVVITRVRNSTRNVTKESNQQWESEELGHASPIDTRGKSPNDDRMFWTCSMCGGKFTDRSSYIGHGCHFR